MFLNLMKVWAGIDFAFRRMCNIATNMGDINNPSRKRKSNSDGVIFEISNEDLSPEPSTEPEEGEIEEPVEKLARIISPLPEIEPNPKCVSDEYANIENGPVVKELNDKVSDLTRETCQLKREIEEINSKVCERCVLRSNEYVDEKGSPIFTVQFKSEDVALIYKQHLLKCIEHFVDLKVCSVSESDLKINVFADVDVSQLDGAITSTPLQAKKCKKRKKNKPDPFVLDTTPTLSTKCNNSLQYNSKFGIIENISSAEITEDDAKAKFIQECFNCNENHSLRDCPHPKNFSKINAARQKFQQNKVSRYHLEDDQKYGHLIPGQVSSKLRKALALRSHQLPEYIYRMRQLGYPPGWLEEAQLISSDLTLFDFDGNDVRNKNKKMGIDPEKVVEYPGFNVPMEAGFKDEYMLYRCPPFSKDYSKEAMLNYFQQLKKKAEDDLEVCDMEVDIISSEKVVEQKPETRVQKLHQSAPCDSPSLMDLESKKVALLAALENSTTPVDESSTVEIPVAENSIVEISSQSSDIFEVIDCTETSQDIEIDVLSDDSAAAITKCNKVKMSSLGTPILKSASPYSRLPNPDNFSQNISDVINFENLPNSTGKYEKITGVLQKVRKTLKNLNECKS